MICSGCPQKILLYWNQTKISFSTGVLAIQPFNNGF